MGVDLFLDFDEFVHVLLREVLFVNSGVHLDEIVHVHIAGDALRQFVDEPHRAAGALRDHLLARGLDEDRLLGYDLLPDSGKFEILHHVGVESDVRAVPRG